MYSDLLDQADRLAALAAAASTEAEHQRRLTPEVVEALRRSGLTGLGLPSRLQGRAAPPMVTVEVLERVAAGDGAAAWVVMINATSSLVAAYLPWEGAQRVFAGGPSTLTAGVFAPKGLARASSGGYRVSGQWPFASGSLHASWISGGCRVEGDGGTRTMFFPAADVSILDTWHTSGLRATGSHDFRVDDVEVPEELTASLESGAPWTDEPLYRLPVFGMLALGVAAVSLGIARGAIDDLTGMAGAKVPTGSSRTLAARPAVQEAVARAEAALGSARAYLLDTAGELWTRVCHGAELGGRERAGLRLAATHAVEAATVTVDAMYRAGGGSAIYETSRLQQRFRDVHTATQHMMVAQPTWEVVGRVLLGVGDEHAQL